MAGAFANDCSHPRPAQDRETHKAQKEQTSARLLNRRNPPLRGREDASDGKPNAERKQQCSDGRAPTIAIEFDLLGEEAETQG
jgi:hypothetical protein